MRELSTACPWELHIFSLQVATNNRVSTGQKLCLNACNDPSLDKHGKKYSDGKETTLPAETCLELLESYANPRPMSRVCITVSNSPNPTRV